MIREDLERKALEEADREFGDVLTALSALGRAANEAIDAIIERERLRLEVEYWKTQYDDCLRQSIKHGEAMMGNLLRATIHGSIRTEPDAPIQG